MPGCDSSGIFLASSCLCGMSCRYDGRAAPHPLLVDLFRRGLALPVCPETLGGLPTPRPPAEIAGDRVMDRSGRDVTEAFTLGAARTLEIARSRGMTVAVLKERSPSCGVTAIYDGTFSGRLIPGCGVTAALLRANDIAVYSEETFESVPLCGQILRKR